MLIWYEIHFMLVLSCKINIFALRKIVLEPKYLEMIAPLIVVIGIIFENCHIVICCTRLWKCFFWARLLFMILNHVVHCTIQKPIGHHHRNKNPWRGFFQKIKDYMREGADVRFVSMFQFSTYISFDYNAKIWNKIHYKIASFFIPISARQFFLRSGVRTSHDAKNQVKKRLGFWLETTWTHVLTRISEKNYL